MTDSEEKKVQPPSATRQMNFIMENSSILNRETKLMILQIAIQEVDKEAVMENAGSREVDLNLDHIAANNPDALLQIYNIVQARLDLLNRPMRGAQSPAK